MGAWNGGAGPQLRGRLRGLTGLLQGTSSVSHSLAAPQMPMGFPILPAAASSRRWGANGPRLLRDSTRVLVLGATAGHTRPLPGPRLWLRGGTGSSVPASPGVPVPPQVGAAGSGLLAVRPAAVGGVGALQGRVHLVNVGDVPDVGLLDLLGVDALPGGQDPQRGPSGAQRPDFRLCLGSARPPAISWDASLCRRATSGHVGGSLRVRAPAGGSTEEGAAGAALAPGHEVATAGFGLPSPVSRLPAAGRLRRGKRRSQRPPVPQLQPLQVPHLGVPGRLVLEADAGRGRSPRPPRPPAARLPARRVAQAPAVPRGDARPPAGLPAMGTDRRTQASCRGCPATLGKQGGSGKTQCKR